MLLAPSRCVKRLYKDRNTAERTTDRGVQGDITIYEEVVEADGLDCTDGSVCYMYQDTL